MFIEVAFAYEVNIYDTTDPKRAMIEIVDNCQQSHKLVLDKKRLNDDAVVEWAEHIDKKMNNCTKNSVKSIDK